jgi:hypothetical protein
MPYIVITLIAGIKNGDRKKIKKGCYLLLATFLFIGFITAIEFMIIHK